MQKVKRENMATKLFQHSNEEKEIAQYLFVSDEENRTKIDEETITCPLAAKTLMVDKLPMDDENKMKEILRAWAKNVAADIFSQFG